MKFENLNLNPTLLQTLHNKGYHTPTPIQEKAIPSILEGRDIFGLAQTGTGKTAAFALPLLQMLHGRKSEGKKVRALILAPTRELAQQISDSVRDYGKGLHLKHTVIYGGVSQRPQETALRNGVEIAIATPGRLLDLCEQGIARLEGVEYFVLDEVDKMLDMGFLEPIRKIISRLPAKKQTLFFSATLPSEIRKLADGLLQNPITVQTAPVSSAAPNVKQFVYYVQQDEKRKLLKTLLNDMNGHHTLVFMRTKRSADKLVKFFSQEGVRAEAIHGDKTQAARQKALSMFRSRKVSLLIATDVASRGLDITDITHVVNYDMPFEAEDYVHRIGRTGRAGATGMAITFCTPEDGKLIRAIGKLAGANMEVLPMPEILNNGGEAMPRQNGNGDPVSFFRDAPAKKHFQGRPGGFRKRKMRNRTYR